MSDAWSGRRSWIHSRLRYRSLDTADGVEEVDGVLGVETSLAARREARSSSWAGVRWWDGIVLRSRERNEVRRWEAESVEWARNLTLCCSAGKVLREC